MTDNKMSKRRTQRQTTTQKTNKNIDIKLSAHDTFLESPLLGGSWINNYL
jgi:hypothetical protein